MYNIIKALGGRWRYDDDDGVVCVCMCVSECVRRR